jgi:MFS family permease
MITKIREMSKLLECQKTSARLPNSFPQQSRYFMVSEPQQAARSELTFGLATYVTFETPFAILLKKWTPRVLLTSLCIVWSLTTIFSGFIQNVGGLYASRLVLGACEAGLFPSLTLYLTMVYRREEQAKRVAYLFSCTALAGAFGGLLAYALLQMDGVANYAGWR